MNTVLSFMDKLYSDSKTLSIVYVIGAVLLFIFIILLMVSLRKTDKKEQPKIIEEPKIDDEPKDVVTEEKKEEALLKEELVQEKEEIVEEVKEEPLEQSIFEKTTIIPLSELEEQPSREENIAQALENVEKQEQVEETKLEDNTEKVTDLSKDIPNVDAYVESIMKKAYEKNEQFSSVFVGNNTSTIKLDKVMENLNVDEEVKDNIIPEEEKSVESENIQAQSVINEEVPVASEVSNEEEIELPKVEEKIETPKTLENKLENTVSLDGLKKALEEKQKEVTLKQDNLKAKLDGLKQEQIKSNETMKAEDLLNKLNSMKEK